MEAAAATEAVALVPAEAVPHLLPPGLVAVAAAQGAERVAAEVAADLHSTTRPG